MDKNYAVFILTHGRSDRVSTYHTLRRYGYTGDIYLIVDNEDEQLNQYKEIFGREVIVFDKKESSKKTDTMDTVEKRNVVVFARNQSFEIAKDLGLSHFFMFDDDYSGFSYKFNPQGDFKTSSDLDLNVVFDAMVNYYDEGNFHCLALAQAGDYMGGEANPFGKGLILRRKAMNTMLCSPDKPFDFIGRSNEDVNAYVSHGKTGKLFGTVSVIMVTQKMTQTNEKGMTDVYLQYGTYAKSFYSVICNPSAVKVFKIGHASRRLHHRVNFVNAVPKIISKEWKK